MASLSRCHFLLLLTRTGSVHRLWVIEGYLIVVLYEINCIVLSEYLTSKFWFIETFCQKLVGHSLISASESNCLCVNAPAGHQQS